MREVSVRSPVGVLLVALVLGALAWPMVRERVATETAPDAPGCPRSGDLPSAGQIAQARSVLLCLHNAERAKHSLPAVRLDARLNAAAQRHSDDMARRRFFAHESPDGLKPADRARRAGYREGAVGENLAWGEEAKGSPVSIMQGWMESPGHRRNVLRRGYEEVGFGVTLGGPDDRVRGRAVTYVAKFGVRR